MKKALVLNYIKTNNLIGIKAGLQRQTFLDIWMVIVNNRIFARSWGLSDKSWYNSFLQDSTGQLKCGDTIFNIKAIVPANKNNLTSEINNAYLKKYNTGHNIPYAKGIIEPKHVEKTLEFIIEE